MLKIIYPIVAFLVLAACGRDHVREAEYRFFEEKKVEACAARGLIYRHVRFTVSGSRANGSHTARRSICMNEDGALYEFRWINDVAPIFDRSQVPPLGPTVSNQTDICVKCSTAR